MSIAVGIVEDDPVVLDGISRILEASNQVRLVGAARCGAEALALARANQIDVYLVDLGLPDMDGTVLIAQILAEAETAQCMVLSAFGDMRHIAESLTAGATGYLLKDEIAPDLIEKIVKLHNGASPLSPLVAKVLVGQFQRRSHDGDGLRRRQAGIAHYGLAPREVEVLDHLAQGLPIVLIAEQMAVSSHTVNQHLRGVYRKLQVHSRSMAVYTARHAGILSDE